MMEILILIAFCWLFFGAVGLAFRAAWGVAKIAATILFAIAVPTLVAGLVFAGGVLLLIPLAMVAIAFGLLAKCI